MTANTITQTHDPSLPAQRSTGWLRLFYLMAAVWVMAVLAFNIFKPIKVLPRLSLAPGFAFTNQDGVRKTSEDFRGKLTIYNFTYTGAVDLQQTTPQMRSLRHALVQSAERDVKFAFVTISIDPEHDTPDVLNRYAAHYLIDESGDVSWDFLASDALHTKYVVGGGFGVYYQTVTDQTGQSSIKFEPRYVLVDGWGIVRAEYRAADTDLRLLTQDIGYLASEIRNSRGVARYAYEAIHLFVCYH